MTVGENIRKLRLEKGMTQKELGEKCGIADSAIRRYELGGANPKMETLHKIANALDIEVTSLLPDYSSFKDNLIQESPLLSAMKRSGFDDSLSKDFLKMRMLEELDITEDKQELIYTYNRLNAAGKSKARDYVKDLTQIPDYTKKYPDQQTE